MFFLYYSLFINGYAEGYRSLLLNNTQHARRKLMFNTNVAFVARYTGQNIEMQSMSLSNANNYHPTIIPFVMWLTSI